MTMAPIIGELKQALNATGDCIFARMSGSGPTVFGLFQSAGKAEQARYQLARNWPQFWVVSTPLGT